ncbi:Single-strand binding protein family protein [Sphingobium sp. AP50]|uniref:single-stranded DNA-binding protein n=1 Tax=Sphingobium sp. AP50 TaxID=1884369 RepID=UPI0008B48D6B|nr:single-stranded DNA-binding protein [Sphingobium sp. AP50]SEJ80276.1 Single-strand binding protein family protein [Sphingobium sp. AP50]
MINFAKFEIIGRVGDIDAKTKVTNVSVCANYRRRGDGDEWLEDSYWNRVVVFADGQRKYITDRVHVGDLVRVAGRLRDVSYEKDGETHYATDRIVEEFGVLSAKTAADQHDDTPRHQPRARRGERAVGARA